MLNVPKKWEGTENHRLGHEPTLVTYSGLDAFEAQFRNNCF